MVEGEGGAVDGGFGDGASMMEMPIPCPTCDRTVELNDMNTCGSCNEMFCSQCLKQSWEDCDNCNESLHHDNRGG